MDPRIQGDQKIPKLDPQLRRAQYLVTSHLHKKTVCLFRNLSKRRISPQFHLVYDDYFETFYIHSDKPPEFWDNLIQFNRIRYDFDDTDYTPELKHNS